MEPAHMNPPPSKPWRWFPEFLELGRERFRAQGRLLGSCILVGVVAGLGAVLFSLACQVVVRYTLEEVVGYQAGTPAHEAQATWIPEAPIRPFLPWLLLLVPTVGGVVTGLIIFTWAPEAEGHGTDAAIDAYHNRQGYIRPRVPLIKLVASAITIGTGGSGGREGPIAQIGAGFGSVLGRLLRMPPAHRRVLMAAGVGAGIAAIFRAPLAGALFAAEVLYRSPEFESEVIIPAGIASVVAYCVFGAFFDFQPLFATPPNLAFDSPLQLAPYTLLGLAMAVLAMLYTRTFNGLTYLFRRIPISPYFKPPIGAFLTGAIGLALYYLLGDQRVLSVLSFGYGILQHGMNMGEAVAAGARTGELTATLLLAVAVGKILTTSLTIGSGGSGGVFGPSMVIGGCGGGALGLFLHRLNPGLVPQPTAFMIVGMAGFFAAAGKVPFSTLVIVSEMTGNYLLLLPALWVCSLSYLLSDEQSLYQSQVEDRAHSPAHQGRFVREALAGLSVGQFLPTLPEVPLVHPSDPLAKVVAQLSGAPFSVLPVVDDNHRLLGVVVLDEVYVASQSPHASPWVLAEDLMRGPITPLQPGDRLDRAQELFVANDLRALPVVEDLQTQRVIGMVRRSDVARTYLRRLQGDGVPG